MRPVAWMLGVALLAGGAAGAQAPKPPFQPEDLFALQAASDPQISPDGRQIAYVRIAYDVMTDEPTRSIWLVDVASGAQRPMDGSFGKARRAGRRTASGWPMWRREPTASARRSMCAGWRAARARPWAT